MPHFTTQHFQLWLSTNIEFSTSASPLPLPPSPSHLLFNHVLSEHALCEGMTSSVYTIRWTRGSCIHTSNVIMCILFASVNAVRQSNVGPSSGMAGEEGVEEEWGNANFGYYMKLMTSPLSGSNIQIESRRHVKKNFTQLTKQHNFINAFLKLVWN